MKDFNIPIPEGYIIDADKSNLAKGIIKFKRVVTILNWKDFIRKEPLNGYITMEQFYDKYGNNETEFTDICGTNDTLADYTNFNSAIFSNIAEAMVIVALIKLLLVRSAYIGDWKPNWRNTKEYKYIIENCNEITEVVTYTTYKSILSFPTKEMAELFLDNNIELLEEYYRF